MLSVPSPPQPGLRPCTPSPHRQLTLFFREPPPSALLNEGSAIIENSEQPESREVERVKMWVRGQCLIRRWPDVQGWPTSLRLRRALVARVPCTLPLPSTIRSPCYFTCEECCPFQHSRLTISTSHRESSVLFIAYSSAKRYCIVMVMNVNLKKFSLNVVLRWCSASTQ